MSAISSTLMGMAMIAAFALIIGGAMLVRVRETRMRGALMVVAALVLIGNVAIWMI